MAEQYEFSNEFTLKILALYVRDPTVYQQFGSVVQAGFFENEIYSKIATWATWFYKNKYGTLTEESLLIIVDSKLHAAKSIVFEGYIKTVRSIYKLDLTDAEFVKSKILEFAKWAAAKAALLKCARVIRGGSSENYGQLRKLLDDALMVGAAQNTNQAELFSTIDQRTQRRIAEQEDPSQFRIATGCMPFVDKALKYGGMRRGEFGLIIAPYGIGKSIVLLNLAIAAARQRKKVILFTLEMSREEYEDRFDAWYSKVPMQNLWKNQKRIAGAERAISRFGGRILIKQFPTKRATVGDLQTFIQIQRNQGFMADVVCVDYWDLLCPSHYYDQERFNLKDIGEGLRGMGIEEQTIVWTATQSNAAGARAQTTRGEHASEGYNKNATADLTITLSQKEDERIRNIIRFYIDKNRQGIAHITMPYKLDYPTYRMVEQMSDDDDE